jgi:HK97 family phage portal protein
MRPVLRSRDAGISLPPPAGAAGLGYSYVYDAQSARRVPALARALQLYAGLVKQMPMDAYRGYDRLPQPRILKKPDLERGGSEFVGLCVEDYLLSGNALALVVARGADGWPLAVKWLPAQWVYIQWNPYDPSQAVTYYYLTQELPLEDVIHVRRSADRWYPVRGVGVVEEHLGTLDRVAQEEEYERGALSDAGVPSVAVIAPQASLSQETAEEAKASWLDKFTGPVREPVILPNGTTVVPLAWSPGDTQLAEMRRLSLLDVGNIFNLDGYWLGAPVAGMTYRTAGPQYMQVLRTSLEPVLADFEDIWSDALFPRGTSVRFRRDQLLREDLATSMLAATQGYGAGILSLQESRVLVGAPPTVVGSLGSGADQSQPPDDQTGELPDGTGGGDVGGADTSGGNPP